MTTRPIVALFRIHLLGIVLALTAAGNLAAETVWLGNSSNWFDEANWSDGVPDATTDAVVGNLGSPFPIINSGTAEVRNLILDRQSITITQGGRLQASEIFAEFGDQMIRVNGTGSELQVAGDMRLGGTSPPTGGVDLILVEFNDGAFVSIGGTLELGDPNFELSSGFRAVNLRIQGADTVVEVGQLDMAVQINDISTWRDGATVRVANGITVGNGALSSQRQFVLRFGSLPSTLGVAPLLDLTGEDPTIELLNAMVTNEIYFFYSDDEYRFESAAGVPISIRGGFDVYDESPGHTVANGHHEVNLWRVEQGSAEFNGSVDGLVELLIGTSLISAGEITRLHSQAPVQVGTLLEPGTLIIGESFVQTSAGSTRLRVQADAHDQLISNGTIDFQGGNITIEIAEDAEPGIYRMIENELGFVNFAPFIEIINHSTLSTNTITAANFLRLELTAPGELHLDPSSLDFGEIAVGEFADQTVTLSNIGQSGLSLAIGEPEMADFSRNGGNCPDGFAFSLASGQECTVVVRFAPSQGGEIVGTLPINLPDDDDVRALDLSGRGNAGPDIFSDRFEAQR
jgi:hypothetical protein